MLNFGFGAFNFIPFEKKTRTFSFQLELSLVIISLFGAVFYGLSPSCRFLSMAAKNRVRGKKEMRE